MKVEIKNELQTPFKILLVVALWGSKNASLIIFMFWDHPPNSTLRGKGVKTTHWRYPLPLSEKRKLSFINPYIVS